MLHEQSPRFWIR